MRRRPLALALMATAGVLTAPLVGSTASAADTVTATSVSISVPAGQVWTDTGIDVTGTVRLSPSGTIDVGGPEGSLPPTGSKNCTASATSYGGQWTADGFPCWSLIGRVGDGPVFAAGRGGSFSVSSGRLFLGVNDELGQYGDNNGSWTVQVDPSGGPGTSAPAAPSGVRSVAKRPNSFRITWRDNSSDESGFQIYNGVESRYVRANTQSYDWPAKPKQYMCITVRAYNPQGNSSWAGMWTCTTTPQAAIAPNAPSGVRSVAKGPNSFRITWRDNSSDESGFQIYNGVESRYVRANTQSYDWPAKPKQYMCITVRAYNPQGNSSWAGMWTCTTTPPAGDRNPGKDPGSQSKRLSVPFATQMGTAGDPSKGGNNCGPASVTMAIRFYGGKTTVEDSAVAIRGKNGPGNGTTDFKSQNAKTWLTKYGLTIDDVTTLDDVRAAINAGRPVIVLVNNNQYRNLEPRPYQNNNDGWFTKNHIVVVTGFDDTNVYVNDPLRSTADYAIPLATFKQAASTTTQTTETRWYASSVRRA